ncbi:MAG: scyllo-inosose 3-dehydrogenase [Chloroflexota bacterium]|nr:scyllo-inosose 3-dehydrogenase [Chloroflexota bacterium]
MKTLTLSADWSPRPDFRLGKKDVDRKRTYLGSNVWRNPRLDVCSKPDPTPGEEEVVIRVRACGICGSDVHMAQADEAGYTLYPGLTAFPVILGHEFSGEVVEAGRRALNKRTGEVFAPGEAVTAEEMLWCGTCRPCADGYPNHCERLEELGFTVDGALAQYVKVPARQVWSLEGLRDRFGSDELYLVGSLTEPFSVSYNALFVRGGGLLPGDNAVVFGGGPIGLAAVFLLKRAGAAQVILSEPAPVRANLGRRLGADHVLNPLEQDVAEAILELTGGEGAKLYLEAAGAPDKTLPQMMKCIWEGKALNSVVVLVGRADRPIPLDGEVFQVRRASLVGSQGHSGHGIFPSVLKVMAASSGLTQLITQRISIDQAPDYLCALRTDKEQCKVTVTDF